MAITETSVEGRSGGLEAWSPSITPPVGVQLTDEQKLAIAFRSLARDGFSENISGHITWQRPGEDHLLVNPWGLWWRELSASDICEIALDGRVLSGKWDVTPAFHIHTELHRRRPDARVVVHNHPYYVCLMAALGILPDIVHQSGTAFWGDLVVINEYEGEVDSAEMGGEMARQIGDASVVILASHGVIVTGPTIEEATFRSATIDRVCHLAYDLMVLGRSALRIDPAAALGIKKSILERGSDVYFNGVARMLIKEEPDVLD